MFCPKCGNNIGNNDNYCRFCGASLKGGNRNNNNGVRKNVNVNINKNIPGTHKKGNVLGAIQYAFKSGAFNIGNNESSRRYHATCTAEDMSQYVLDNNKTARYDIEQSIYQIVNLFKSGAFNIGNNESSRRYHATCTAEDKIWQALKK